jgi:hypothetical protein
MADPGARAGPVGAGRGACAAGLWSGASGARAAVAGGVAAGLWRGWDAVRGGGGG